MKEIEPEHWIAPRLRSGESYLEPMQGAHLRTMGVLKPWAPPRSYGLVVRLSATGQPVYSLHSRVDGINHGVVAAAEFDGALYLLAKGPGRAAATAHRRHREGVRVVTQPILELRQATKLYGGQPAIDKVDFDLREGEIHALVGENGAGKSTLTKVMAGVVTLTSGAMLIAGKEIEPRTPLEARNLGIAMVFQETSLVPSMTVAQNLFLGQEKFFNRLRGIYIAAQQFLQSLQFRRRADRHGLDPGRRQEADGRDRARRAAQRQGHHLRRADREPDAGGEEVLLRPGARAEARGVSVIFISHALEEALLISDRITVLRDGRHVVTDDTPSFDRARIVQAMVGRDLSKTLYAERKAKVRPPGERVLTIENLRMLPMVKNNSLSIFAGQVTGIFGLVGSGRTETFKVVGGRHEARLLPRRRDLPARQAGAVPDAGAGDPRRHRLRHRGPQGRGLLRDHVDRPQHLCRPDGQARRAAGSSCGRRKPRRSARSGPTRSRSARSART